MMKKILGLFSILLLILVLASCGGGTNNNDSNENYIKVMQINELIEKLPDEITLNEEEKITQIIGLYDSLPNTYREKINGYEKVLDAKELIIKLKQDETNKNNALLVINLINALPSIDNIKLSNNQEVQTVLTAYNALNEDAKKLVNNYEILEQIIAKLEQLKNELAQNVKEVENAINALNKNLTLNDKEEVINVRNMYENLTNDEKILINNLDILISAENKIQELEIIEKYKADALIVTNLISNLPQESNLKLEDKDNVVNARSAYEALDSDAKQYVSGLSKLTTLEARIVTLETAYSDAKEFDNLVKSLPDVNTLDLDDAEKVKNARDEYTNLTVLAKTYVTMISKLIELEEQLIILENAETINILDCVSDVVTSNTLDTLILETKDATYTWTSSNKNLYVINGDEAYVNMAYQKHQTQKVTVSVKINYKSGGSETKSKEITVDPVLFDNMPSTPVATYYQSGATSSYYTYSERYKTEKTLFSTKAKEVLDIVYYAFAIPSSDGTISISNMIYFNEVIKIRESGVRVVLSINGVGTETFNAFNTITKDTNLINTFVKNTMDLVDANYLDGVDIDWESLSSTNKVNPTQMNNLVKVFRAEMTNRQAANGSNYLLTAAIPGTSWGAGSDRFDLKTLNNYLDYVNMMSYDSNRTDKTTHHAPLYKSSNDGGYGFGVDYATTLFANSGLSKSKIIIGAAGYGKAFKITGTVSSTSKYPGLGVGGTLGQISGISGSYASGTLFGNAVETLLKNSNYVKYTEYNSSNQIVASYLYSATDKIFVTYDSSEVIEAKYNYASKVNGMGIMCWAYTEDTSDTYINTIYDVIN